MKPPVMAFPFKDSEFGLQPGMSLLDYYAASAPIPFEMALKAWGDDNIDLVKDSDLKAFYAVWAYLRYEYAAAMMEEREARQN
jgi:hypothetical protein